MAISLDQCIWAYHNGKITHIEKATVPVTTHSLNFGTSIFESLRVYETKNGASVLALDAHLKRLKNSVQFLGLSPFNLEEIRESILEVVRINTIKDGYLRVLVYPEGNCLTLDASNQKTAYSVFGWHVNGDRFMPPISLGISFLRRANPGATLPYSKVCGLYVIDFSAHQNVRKQGFDDALILNEDGTVCEVTGANIFCIKDSCIYTPFINNSIQGITRQIISELSADLKIPYTEAMLTIDDFLMADEVFISGTFHGIRAITSIAGQVNYTAAPGHITKLLIQRYKDMLSDVDSQLSKWLTTAEKRETNEDLEDERQYYIKQAVDKDNEFINYALKELLKELRGVPDIQHIEGVKETFERVVYDSDIGKVFIAFTGNGEPVGYISISFHDAIHCGGKVAILEELWVRPEYRAHSIGILLVRKAEQYIRTKGVKRVEVGLAGQDYKNHNRLFMFYKQLGYVEIGPRMKKVLK